MQTATTNPATADLTWLAESLVRVVGELRMEQGMNDEPSVCAHCGEVYVIADGALCLECREADDTTNPFEDAEMEAVR